MLRSAKIKHKESQRVDNQNKSARLFAILCYFAQSFFRTARKYESLTPKTVFRAL